MLAKVRKNGYVDLSYGNFVMDGLQPPEKPVPSTDKFISGEQQTVTIMGGALEEIALADQLAGNLWDTNLRAVVIKDPYSQWEPKEDDLALYGIQADHQTLRWYFIVDLSDGTADIFPKFDTPFYAYRCAEYNPRPIPVGGISAEELNHIRHEVISNLRLAETKSEMAEMKLQQKLAVAIKKGNTTKEESLKQKLLTVRNDVYTNFAANFLFDLIPVPSPEAVQDHADEPLNAQIAATALHLSEALRQQDGESDIEWEAGRIHNWIRDNACRRTRQSISGYGEAFRIVRRHLLPEMPANVALCEVTTAEQSNWPIGMKKPPVKLDLPHVTVKGPINKFMANIWHPVQDAPASTKYPTVIFKAWFKPDHTTIKAECASITELNSRKDVPAKKFWDYTKQFGQPRELHDWLQQYPALGRQVKIHRHIGERHDVLSRLDRVPYGYAAIAGGPGSGKTTLAEDIVLAVVSEPAHDAVITRVPSTTDEVVDHDVSQQSIDHGSQASRRDIEAEQVHEPIGTFAVGTAQMPDTWTFEAVAEPAQPIGKHDIPKVAWIGAENQLCDDAQVHLSAKAPDVLTLRARPWRTEMANMFSPCNTEPTLISTDEKPHATAQDERLAGHMNRRIRARYEKKSASRGPMTISQYAKNIAQADSDTWALYLSAYRQKFTDPEAFSLNREENEQSSRDLLTHA
ncbi:mfs monocarboxylate transporter [Fusarium longipes]|uniref:Mfs monocarboxylate transporter n=1 Tax=Fusarium longipes TaxID=694270 RepID=A0A395T727_9HYPO|nr:mfs monocarboxylate transporter [Fusarium longipes]